MGNYQRHLRYELDQLEKRAEHEAFLVMQCEERLHKSWAEEQAAEIALRNCQVTRKKDEETFRYAHKIYCGTRQKIGEIQSELGCE